MSKLDLTEDDVKLLRAARSAADVLLDMDPAWVIDRLIEGSDKGVHHVSEMESDASRYLDALAEVSDMLSRKGYLK